MIICIFCFQQLFAQDSKKPVIAKESPATKEKKAIPASSTSEKKAATQPANNGKFNSDDVSDTKFRKRHKSVRHHPH